MLAAVGIVGMLLEVVVVVIVVVVVVVDRSINQFINVNSSSIFCTDCQAMQQQHRQQCVELQYPHPAWYGGKSLQYEP